jgi:hypothetical protein
MEKIKALEAQELLLERKIKTNQENIKSWRSNLLNNVTSGTDYDIATFGPSYIEKIQKSLRNIDELQNQLDMLHWIMETIAE